MKRPLVPGHPAPHHGRVHALSLALLELFDDVVTVERGDAGHGDSNEEPEPRQALALRDALGPPAFAGRAIDSGGNPIVGARGWSGIAWRPVIDNVTLFVPFGAALAALWCRRSWPVVLLAAAILSIGVEAFQWAFPTGRIANSADVIANTIGTGLGIALARMMGACPGARLAAR